MSGGERAKRIILAILVVMLVGGLRVWYYLDPSYTTIAVIVVVSLTFLGAVKLLRKEPPSRAEEAEPAPRLANTNISYQGKTYNGLEAMPPAVLRGFLDSLERAAQTFPQSFSTKLMLVGRLDLAREFDHHYDQYKMGRLSQEALKPKIRQVMEKLEAWAARRSRRLVDFTHNGVTYAPHDSVPPHLNFYYKKELERILKSDPARFDHLLEQHGLTGLLSELQEIRRLRDMSLIGEAEFEAALQEILARLAA